VVPASRPGPVPACRTALALSWVRPLGRTAAWSRCSAPGGLCPGSALESVPYRVHPAGPEAGAFQPPGSPRSAVAGQPGGYPPGRVEFTPDGDVKSAVLPRRLAILSRAAAISPAVGRSPGRPGWMGTNPSQRAARATGPASWMHPGHPPGGPRQQAAPRKDTANRHGPGGPIGSTRQTRPVRRRFPAGRDRPGRRRSRAPPARGAGRPRRPDRDDQPPGERTSSCNEITPPDRDAACPASLILVSPPPARPGWRGRSGHPAGRNLVRNARHG
jgi:hypothetical protein